MKRRFLASFRDVAEAIKAERLAAGISQSELATQAGVKRRFIVQLEAAQPTADLPEVLAVLTALNIHAMALPAPPAVTKSQDEVDLTEVLAGYA